MAELGIRNPKHHLIKELRSHPVARQKRLIKESEEKAGSFDDPSLAVACDPLMHQVWSPSAKLFWVRGCSEQIIAAKACHVGERCGRYRKIYILAQTHVGLDQLFISCRRCGFALSESIKGFEGGVKQMVQFRTLLRGFRSYDLTLR